MRRWRRRGPRVARSQVQPPAPSRGDGATVSSPAARTPIANGAQPCIARARGQRPMCVGWMASANLPRSAVAASFNPRERLP